MFKISRGYEHISKTFRIPLPLLDRLEGLAYKNNISLNQLVIQCLEYAMENLCED
jgi:predicted HicB family RNase H-like nuclease